MEVTTKVIEFLFKGKKKMKRLIQRHFNIKDMSLLEATTIENTSSKTKKDNIGDDEEKVTTPASAYPVDSLEPVPPPLNLRTVFYFSHTENYCLESLCFFFLKKCNFYLC